MNAQWWKGPWTAVVGLATRCALSTAVVITAWLGSATTALATPVLDQSYICTVSCGGVGFGTQFAAQTFTAGLSGTLSEVNISFLVFNGPGPVDVAIRDVAGGVPGSNILGSTTFLTSSLSMTDPITFPQTVNILAGSAYAIVVHSATHDLNWNDVGLNNDYTSGALLISPTGSSGWFGCGGTPGNCDGSFRTFVEPVPEPGMLLLVGSGLAGLGAWRARRGRGRC